MAGRFKLCYRYYWRMGCSSCEKKPREPGHADATASKRREQIGTPPMGLQSRPACHPQPKFVCGSGILYKSPPRLPPPSGGAGVARARWESPQGSSPGMHLCRAPTILPMESCLTFLNRSADVKVFPHSVPLRTIPALQPPYRLMMSLQKLACNATRAAHTTLSVDYSGTS